MRNMVIDEIENIVFSPCNSSRWSYMSIKNGIGLVRERTKRNRKLTSSTFSLLDAEREDFEALTDEALLTLLTAVVRQASKQM